MMAKLAIITICRNDREGLQRTIQSVQAQTFRDLAHIVVDGASSDGSRELIEANAEHIERWVSEPDQGIYDAQNKGWRMADTPFVLFLNSGDVFAGNDVLDRARHLMTDDVDIAYGDTQLSNRNGTYRVKRHPVHMNSAWLMKEVVGHSAQFIRRALLERAGGYDTRYHIAADYAFFAWAFWQERSRVRGSHIVISTFDTEGLSSHPEQKQRVAKERKAIQARFAPRFWFMAYHAYAAFNRSIGR
ncbi:MAG: glycosyltransferase [Flavobacteriales bacterium]|nr:glycosyltransferase [Flavobacteriales bacterium]